MDKQRLQELEQRMLRCLEQLELAASRKACIDEKAREAPRLPPEILKRYWATVKEFNENLQRHIASSDRRFEQALRAFKEARLEFERAWYEFLNG